MDVSLEPGIYVVAVSGGVDSMSLLNMLSKVSDVRLVVAHFDHGIRPDSAEDRRLVQQAAEQLQLPFVFHEGRLGEGTSEAEARKARYDFLHSVRKAAGAKAIITAHHQDDALETAIHHLMRGTGRRGLSALYHNSKIIRPLLDHTKQDLLSYARNQGVLWREDSTNADTAYTRNYIRSEIIPKLSSSQKKKLLTELQTARPRNQEIDKLLDELLDKHTTEKGLDRSWFIGLPHAVAREVIAAWLRLHDILEYDKKMLEQLVRAAKTGRSGTRANIDKTHKMAIQAKKLALIIDER